MNILKNILMVLLFSSTTAIAAPATDSSLKQLLTVTHAKKLIDGMRTKIDAQLDSIDQQALKGETPSPSQQQALTNMRNKVTALMHGMLAWEKLEPMYLRLYKETFTEEEIVGMLAFYKTPAGQAVINKMPVLTHKLMFEIKGISSDIMPKMQKIQHDFIVEQKAAIK
ncbi:MAG: DUF2059 domain-containing protein [Gallionellaceae bacterium]